MMTTTITQDKILARYVKHAAAIAANEGFTPEDLKFAARCLSEGLPTAQQLAEAIRRSSQLLRELEIDPRA